MQPYYTSWMFEFIGWDDKPQIFGLFWIEITTFILWYGHRETHWHSYWDMSVFENWQKTEKKGGGRGNEAAFVPV